MRMSYEKAAGTEVDRMMAELDKSIKKREAAKKRALKKATAPARPTKKARTTTKVPAHSAEKGPIDLMTKMKEFKKVLKAVNKEISNRLKWQSSFKAMKESGALKGARVEVPCAYEEVFGELFEDEFVKRKGNKLTCFIPTDEHVKEIPFNWTKSYRYNSAELRAPFSASFSDNKLVISFKFAIV